MDFRLPRTAGAAAAPVLLAALAAAADPPAVHGPAFDVQLMAAEGCVRCHSNAPAARAMRDADGAGVAPYDLWRSTMMANGARDPVWRAVVSAEVARYPERAAEIEAECMRCHSPLASMTASGRLGDAVRVALTEGDGTWPELARDGVSCTICHQIEPEGLGTEASFHGGFVLNDRAQIYGPHADPFLNPMSMMTGFRPTHGPHVLRAALCGSCHTVVTDVVDEHGAPTGARFAEQTTYLEWRASGFSNEDGAGGAHPRSCQSCHMPTSDAHGARIETAIARNPGGRDFPRTVPRAPFGRHLLVGGNVTVLQLFRDHPEELRVEAPAAAFERTLAATREQLRERTARVRIEAPRRAGERLELDVQVRNLAGHKLPSGIPLRRAWLRVRVTDARGALVFASGEHDARGRILDGAGEVAAAERAGGPLRPHRARVESPDHAAVYQVVTADRAGAPTFGVHAAADRWKDDRLLPSGWDPARAGAEVAPVGTGGDPDFGPGGDTVTYAFEAPAARGPFVVEAALLYQPLDPRWLDELGAFDTAEVRRLGRLLADADLRPEVLAADRLATGQAR